MKWKAVADADDFPERDRLLPLEYMTASGEAYEQRTLAQDIAIEQENSSGPTQSCCNSQSGGLDLARSSKTAITSRPSSQAGASHTPSIFA
jgi:hypothetical protein